jgi:ATP-dependent Clp protease protease subunit
MNKDVKKFWNWIRDADSGERVLRLEGPIDEDNFWGDEITPKDFREELEAEDGDVTLWINSPGGNVFAASEIYTMLRDYKGKITVKIDAIAASAASVVAMAGDTVLMSPSSLLMIHDPSTIAMGNTEDMEHAITVLNEVKEAIINAYADKTGLRRNKIAELMTNETWMNAKKAVELGFADDILFSDKKEDESDGDESGEQETHEEQAGGDENPDEEETSEGAEEEEETEKEGGKAIKIEAPVPQIYSSRKMELAILNRLMAEEPKRATDKKPDKLGADNAPIKNQEPIEDKTSVENSDSIGLDGKTKDGSVPYLILKKQLNLLR